VAAGSWCGANLTDGFVPSDVIEVLGFSMAWAAALERVELFERDSNGIRFHDWADWNPTREQVLARRKAAAARVATWRGRRGSAGQQHAGSDVTPYVTRNTPGVTPLVTPFHDPDERPCNGVTPGDVTPLVTPPPSLSTKASTKTKPSEVLRTSAQTILSDWLDSMPARPPGRIVGQVAKQLGEMLAEGIAPEAVAAGLAAWATRGLHPSVLPSLVHEAQTASRRTSRLATTDQRVAENLAVVERFARKEGLLP